MFTKSGIKAMIVALYERLIAWCWWHNLYLIERARKDPEDAQKLGAAWQQCGAFMHILGLGFFLPSIMGGEVLVAMALGSGLMVVAGQAWWRLGSMLLRARDTEWRQDLIIWMAQVEGRRGEYRVVKLAETESEEFLARFVSEISPYAAGGMVKGFLGRILTHQNRDVRIAAIKLANSAGVARI